MCLVAVILDEPVLKRSLWSNTLQFGFLNKGESTSQNRKF